MQSKMNKYAWWETDGDVQRLYFEQFYDGEEIACLNRGYENDWFYNCEMLGDYEDYLCDAVTSEQEAKQMICDKIISHWEDQRDYYNDMLEKFTSQEGAE